MSRWSAPIPSWIFGVAGRRGKPLTAPVAFLLAYLWTRADAPSKRPAGGHAFLRPRWGRLDILAIATDLRRHPRSVEKSFAALVAEGLIRRGDAVFDGRAEAGIWLADLEHGRFEPAQDPGEFAGYGESDQLNDPGEFAVSTPANSPGDHPNDPGEFAGLYREARSEELPNQDPDHDHVEIAVHAPSPPDPRPPDVRSTESPPMRAGRGRMSQRSLFPDEPSKPTGPTRDPAQEVFDYLAARIVAAKVELGIKPAIGPRVLGKSERRNIDDRIREHGKRPDGSIDLDAGVTACKRVVDVDEADCVRLRSISQYWNATTPFRNAANFEGRLMRWREDGDHQVWGAKPAKGPRQRTDHGFDAYMPEEDFVDELGQHCMGRKSLLKAVDLS
jgi:hypothetical protein